MPDKRTIDDMREDCECAGIKYCPLEVLVKSASARMYEQHKVVERFKWKKSELYQRRVHWEEAYHLWCSEGYAKKFAEIYQEGMLHNEIWEQLNYKDDSPK